MLALLVLYYFLFNPDLDPSTVQSEGTDSTLVSPSIIEEADVQTEVIPTIAVDTAEVDSVQVAAMQLLQRDKFGAFAGAADGEAKEVVLENELLRVVLNTKGGLPTSAILIDGYQTFWDSVDIHLWDENLSEMNLQWYSTDGKEINSKDLFFTSSQVNAKASESQAASVTFSIPTDNPAKKFELSYRLAIDSYQLETTLNIVNFDGTMNTSEGKTVLSWNAAGNHNEKGISSERQRSSVFFREMNEDRDYLSESREDDESPETTLNWVAFKQNFFSAAIISDTGFGKGSYLKSYPPVDEDLDTLHTMFYEARLPLNITSGTATEKFRFFFGPNEYDRLVSTEVEQIDRIIDYGWGIFGWVNRHIVRPMFIFFSGFISNYGLVILIITLIIKAVLFPITWKNYLSSAKMRVLKPEIDEINKKFEGKEAMEKQQAVMGLYRETGVNPMAGCLPMLLQMPILYAMFRFFPASIELRQKTFLWADDLGGYDSILDLGFNIPLYGMHVSGFTLLMAVSTFFYTRMSSSQMPDTNQPGMPNMKVIMNFFPLMMLFIFNSLASGLSFYYFAANVISIGQMYFIKNVIIDEDKIHAKLQDNKKKPKKKSGFQQRLADMQKMQQDKAKGGKKSK